MKASDLDDAEMLQVVALLCAYCQSWTNTKAVAVTRDPLRLLGLYVGRRVRITASGGTRRSGILGFAARSLWFTLDGRRVDLNDVVLVEVMGETGRYGSARGS